MVYTQSRVQMLASFELLAVADLKVKVFNSGAGESILAPHPRKYTHTSFYRAVHSQYLYCTSITQCP